MLKRFVVDRFVEQDALCRDAGLAAVQHAGTHRSRKCRGQIGIEGLTFHDGRATAATLLARRRDPKTKQLQCDPLTLARILGHKNLQQIIDVYYREGIAEYLDESRRMAARGAASTVLALAENLPKIVDTSSVSADVE